MHSSLTRLSLSGDGDGCLLPTGAGRVMFGRRGLRLLHLCRLELQGPYDCDSCSYPNRYIFDLARPARHRQVLPGWPAARPRPAGRHRVGVCLNVGVHTEIGWSCDKQGACAMFTYDPESEEECEQLPVRQQVRDMLDGAGKWRELCVQLEKRQLERALAAGNAGC